MTRRPTPGERARVSERMARQEIIELSHKAGLEGFRPPQTPARDNDTRTE